MEKKSFIFYTSWKKNIDMMQDDELRRFINNLINYTEGNSVDLPTRIEKMVWNDLVEVLNHNERKRERAAERSRKNGQNGGRPTKPKETHQVIEKPIGLNDNPENLLMGNGKLLMGNGKGLNDNGKRLLDIMKQVIEDGYITEEEVKEWKINDTRDKLNIMFKDYPGWESDFIKLRFDDFIYNISLNSKVAVDYKLHALLKAHQIL